MCLQLPKSTFCIPSGNTTLSTAPAKGKAKRSERIKVRNEEVRAAGQTQFPHAYLRKRTDHLGPFTSDADLAVCGLAHQRHVRRVNTFRNNCCGVRRPLDGSHVNLHAGVRNVEFLHARRRQSHEGTCMRTKRERRIKGRNEAARAAEPCKHISLK